MWFTAVVWHVLLSLFWRSFVYRIKTTWTQCFCWKQKYDFMSFTSGHWRAQRESGKPISRAGTETSEAAVTSQHVVLFSYHVTRCGLWAAHFPPLISARLPVHHMNMASHFNLYFLNVYIVEIPTLPWLISHGSKKKSSRQRANMTHLLNFRSKDKILRFEIM